MTDHSILHSGAADLPFKAEARFVSDIFRTLFVDVPKALTAAIRAQQLSRELYVLDSAGLAALGIDRMGIGRYVVEHSGILEQ